VVYTCKGGNKAPGFIKCGVRKVRNLEKLLEESNCVVNCYIHKCYVTNSLFCILTHMLLEILSIPIQNLWPYTARS
jgi:hypothetical protein